MNSRDFVREKIMLREYKEILEQRINFAFEGLSLFFEYVDMKLLRISAMMLSPTFYGKGTEYNLKRNIYKYTG